MKKYILVSIAVITGCIHTRAQGDDFSAIKLFIDQNIIAANNKNLPDNLQKRLFSKMTQLINQTGIADVGYSNFLVTPRFDVLSTSVDEAGISKVWLAECEFTLTVTRREYGNLGAASFASFSKKVVGSGSSKEAAIANGINNISPTDNGIVNFLKESKVKIDNYFKLHCNDVLKEANQAYELNEYNRSIALYFSIPASAPCYEEARETSIGVYMKYIEDGCEKQLIKLRAVVALALSKDSASSARHYNEALQIMSNLDPASLKCYAEAKMQIEKIEKRLDEAQKREWELTLKKTANAADLQKEIVKAMGKISSSYQPAPGGNTIIIAK